MDKPKVVVLGAVFFNKKILLIQRNQNPFKGQWGLIGGKLEKNETIKEGIIREVKEESSLECDFIKINIVDQLMLKNYKSYVAFLSTLNAKSDKFIECDEGKLSWFELNQLPKDMIKADKWLIENCLDDEINVPCFKFD